MTITELLKSNGYSKENEKITKHYESKDILDDIFDPKYIDDFKLMVNVLNDQSGHQSIIGKIYNLMLKIGKYTGQDYSLLQKLKQAQEGGQGFQFMVFLKKEENATTIILLVRIWRDLFNVFDAAKGFDYETMTALRANIPTEEFDLL